METDIYKTNIIVLFLTTSIIVLNCHEIEFKKLLYLKGTTFFEDDISIIFKMS